MVRARSTGPTDPHARGAPPLRVALVVSGLSAGGKERTVAELAFALADRGHRPTVFALAEDGPIGDTLRRGGIPSVLLRSRPGVDPGLPFRLAAAFRQARPDVVHVHDRVSLPHAVLANELGTRVPVVLTSHGALFLELGPVRTVERLASLRLAAATAVSAEAADDIGRLLRLPFAVRVVPNAVPRADAERARPRVPGSGEAPFRFLCVGDRKPEKAYDVLLDAVGALAGRDLGRRWLVEVAGAAGDPEHLQALARHTAELGVGDLVRFLGPRGDVPDLLAASDAFVLPSRREGMPVALLEAMASGRAIVAARVGSVPEVLEEGAAGLLVRAEDSRGFAEAMGRLVMSPDLARDLGARAAAAAGRYTASRMAANYERSYREAGAGALRDPRPGVLMTGPVAPPVGGMATVLDTLGQSGLADEVRLGVLDNASRTRPGRSGMAAAAAQLRLFLRFLRRLRRDRISIVHLHTCSGTSFWRDLVWWAAGRAHRKRTFLHVHGARFGEFAAELGSVRRALLAHALRGAEAVVATGPKWAAVLEAIAPGARVVAVPNGVPVPEPVPERAGSPPVFLFLGGLGRRKGVDLLLRAVEHIMDADVPLRVVVAGPADCEDEAEFAADLVKRGLRGRVESVGVLSASERDRRFREADAFLLPSRAEGLPVAMLEAMAAGLAVVATRVGAVEDVVRDGADGFLVPVDDVRAFADAMASLARDPARRQAMGASARRRILDGFTDEHMARGIARLYRRGHGAGR